jgi:rSAM/selenodomain-associated transferase 2
MMALTISAIIPTFNEAATIEAAVRGAQRVADEVIVVDAGSSDGTRERADAAFATVIASPKGRGTQLHRGAEEARGDVLLFLHADVRAPAEARGAMIRALVDPRIVGGNFHLRYVPASWAARLFTWANHVRRHYLQIYYGDSGLFVRKEAYHRAGGFRPIPLFEDYDLVERLERTGRTAYVREVTLEASARRFERRPVSTLLLWSTLQTLYSAGVSPERLARLYADKREAR